MKGSGAVLTRRRVIAQAHVRAGKVDAVAANAGMALSIADAVCFAAILGMARLWGRLFWGREPLWVVRSTSNGFGGGGWSRDHVCTGELVGVGDVAAIGTSVVVRPKGVVVVMGGD